ncbi:spore coat protein [Ammoniphilus sp. CFH 90114]|uniref:spore coat protein n=1 Tax=Ammoniphilus sp. CFH 90114 TaxID=2493665 RepID=UPI00100E8994|nr:spore coat protein [Ammoniphilus sp. CFH 90114]RXT13678.1 spore coat protein [Ammoniphilus sp. CFH 90114]
MEQPTLSAHESMEIHELLNFKTVCLTRSKLMQGLVFDKDLKALMEKDVRQSVQAIHDLTTLYTRIHTQ